ncbi:hypothetical protein D1013_09235 [Euzebyella marina]|uniref:Uncharacterized protein n=1 Tax=Euzebyella marina TaxID=1761453 RepID=A0A3G2L5S6_9FLAO|nr:DUF6520 family protein [Euzebyella marina]AYN67531.1 hypothetical protein D1013_09235 [Euzebyella marina]
MKNRFLKPVLPAFAILLAMGLAFADASPTADREAYYKPLNQDWQPIMVEEACYQGGDNQCSYLGHQLYSSPSFSSTALSKP